MEFINKDLKMKNLKLSVILISLLSHGAFAKGGPSDNASKASEHSVYAVGHTAASGAQVASAVVAVPLLVVGSVGAVSVAAGSELLDSARKSSRKPKHCDEPLTISDVTITVTHNPADQMKQQ